MSDPPQLYTLAELAEATKYSVRHVARVLARHPFIRSVGRGRGQRLTLDDYNALIEAMRGPGPGYISPEPGTLLPHVTDKNALKQLRRHRTREIAKKIRRDLGRE